MTRLIYVVVAATAALFLGTPAASAQSDARSAEAPTEAQLELNEQGVEAIVAKDYMRAVRLFRASLDLGELNITYVNMGRAYQHAGECLKADENYAAALKAPAIADPPAEKIAAAVHQYRKELRETCHGTLRIECSPQDIAVYIDDKGPLTCDGQPVDFEKGTYTVRGELQGQSTETTVSVTPMTTSTVKLSLTRPPQVTEQTEVAELEDPTESRAERAAPKEDTREKDAHTESPDSSSSQGTNEGVTSLEAPPEVAPSESSKYGAYWMVGSGVSFAGAVALDLLPTTSTNGQLDGMDFAPAGLYAVGTGALIYGIMSLID